MTTFSPRCAAVPMPGTGGSVVDADVVRALAIEGDRVRFLLEVDPAQGPTLEPMRAAAEAAVAALPGRRRASRCS